MRLTLKEILFNWRILKLGGSALIKFTTKHIRGLRKRMLPVCLGLRIDHLTMEVAMPIMDNI